MKTAFLPTRFNRKCWGRSSHSFVTIPPLPYSDGKCAGLVDNSRKCRKWAGEGLCQSAEFSGYMSENCAYSCQGCIKGKIVDQLTMLLTSQKRKHRVSTSDQPNVLFRFPNLCFHCPSLSEVCAVAQDKRSNCASYYSSGWCEPSHAYYREIIQDCQYTCNDCVSL